LLSFSVLGVADATRTEKLICNLVSDRIEPRLVPDLQILPGRRTHVIAVHVFPSSCRPHFLKAQGRERGAMFEDIGSGFRVALSRHGRQAPALDVLDQAILEFATSDVDAHIQRTTRAPEAASAGSWSLAFLPPLGAVPRIQGEPSVL
jgi:hypothetical protein